MGASRWLIAAVFASSACFAPTPPAGAPCATGDVCPTGLSCVGGVCVGDGNGSGSDAAGECTGKPDGTACGVISGSECSATSACMAGACVPSDRTGAVCYDCSAGAGACGTCASGSCPKAACTPAGSPAPAVLTSPLVANNGDEGNMFDVAAKATITITSFEGHFSTAGSTDYEIWTRAGTYVGFEASSAGWTKIGTATFATGGPGVFTAIPIAINVTIPAGQRRGFYLTNHVANNRYHDGTAVGAVLASTPQLDIFEGAGVNFGTAGFSGINTPRAWEGKIHYVSGGGALTALAPTTATADGVMLDLAPIRELALSQLGMRLAAGPHDVTVYFKRGSFAGSEAAAPAWHMLASAPALDSAGTGAPTYLPVPIDLVLGAGATTALYVQATGAVQTGAPAPLTSNADLAIVQAATISGTFGGAPMPATPNVELGYTSCN